LFDFFVNGIFECLPILDSLCFLDGKIERSDLELESLGIKYDEIVGLAAYQCASR